MPFKSLVAVSYLPSSIVTMAVSVAVCEILSVTYNGGLDPLVANDFNFI